MIYKLVNKVNHKIYIGKSKNLRNIWESYNGLPENKKSILMQEMRQYGPNSFEFSVLEECAESQLDSRGSYYMNLYNTENEELQKNSRNVAFLDGAKAKSNDKIKNKKKGKMNEGLKNHIEKMKTDPEYKAKMVQKYKNNRPNAIATNMLDIASGATLMTFPKIMDAAAWIRENTAYNKADYATINKICKGQGKTAYGYKWEYASKKPIYFE